MRRKRSNNRKNEIIETARNLIIQHGVQALTLKNLSKKNNISEAAVYRHFKNKHAILVALIDDFENNLMEAIEKPIRHYENPLHRLREIMKTHMVFTEEKKGIFFSITTESIHFDDDHLRRKILKVIDTYKTKIKDILAEARKKELLRDDINIDAVGLAYFGIIQTAIIQFALTNYKVPPMTKYSTLWNIFLKGIVK